MERFAIKIDKSLRANLYKICRLCGIDNPDKVKVLDEETIVNLEDGEPELWKKVLDCIGLLITKDDKMPQFMCTLCVDKINDFFEFREMCYATDGQTRKLLGIKEEPKLKIPTTSSVDCKTEDQDIKQPVQVPVVPIQRSGRKRRNADIDICNAAQKEIKTDEIEDVKPATSNIGSVSKKKRIKLDNTETDTKPIHDTKPGTATKSGFASKLGPASKVGLSKKRLKIEPATSKEKKDIKPPKMSKLMKKKLKVETPTPVVQEERKPQQLQVQKKKKAIEMLKQRKLAKKVAVVKVEKLRKGSVESKIKEDPPIPVPAPAPNQPKVKLKEKCAICSEGFLNKSLLDKHIKSTHIPTVVRYHCVQCNETLKKNMEIKNHNLWHKLSKTPFQCGNCSESSCSIYTYSKHIRDCGQVAYLDAHIPDWHCPECSGVFETTYLFNAHSCVANILVCPGCDRSHKWKEDYFKHIPICPAAFHRIPSYMSSNIQVKNEAEHPTSPIPPHNTQSLSSAASVSIQQTPPSRATPPLMDSNQCVVIPGNVNLLEEASSPSPKGSGKKSKRITKKDLKRFDKLLKSTMTTLVSIKHEPTQGESIGDEEQSTSSDIRVTSPSPPGSPAPPDDDFHHNDDDDDDSAGEQTSSQPVGTIKQEIIDEGYRDLYNNIEVNIKREVVLNDNRNIEVATPKKSGDDVTEGVAPAELISPKPVLKLKITKEHGTLNSVLLDSPKSERKKKKKRRKEEKLKAAEKEGTNAVQEVTADVREVQGASVVPDVADVSNVPDVAERVEEEPAMPLPGIIRVKKEITEPEDEEEEIEEHLSTKSSHSTPSIVAATSGSLQISCVSEGVHFNGAEENDEEEEEATAEPEQEEIGREGDVIGKHATIDEPQEEIDIKPRLEDLIPMLQIASVSSGEDLIKKPVKTTARRKPRQTPASAKPSISTPQIVSVSSGSEVVDYQPEPEISSEDGEETYEKVDNNENVFDYTQVRIKEEVVDPAYDEQDCEMPQDEEKEEVEEEEGEKVGEETDNTITDKQAEENAYIANIDFNNLTIKQEKEYIDDGLDNPVDDDSSDTDSETSSDTDENDSHSEREYRELPSEDDESHSETIAAPPVLAPLGLQISAVCSEFTCSQPQPDEKTESQLGAQLSSEDKTKSKPSSECGDLESVEDRAEEEQMETCQVEDKETEKSDHIKLPVERLMNSQGCSEILMEVDGEMESMHLSNPESQLNKCQTTASIVQPVTLDEKNMQSQEKLSEQSPNDDNSTGSIVEAIDHLGAAKAPSEIPQHYMGEKNHDVVDTIRLEDHVQPSAILRDLGDISASDTESRHSPVRDFDSSSNVETNQASSSTILKDVGDLSTSDTDPKPSNSSANITEISHESIKQIQIPAALTADIVDIERSSFSNDLIDQVPISTLSRDLGDVSTLSTINAGGTETNSLIFSVSTAGTSYSSDDISKLVDVNMATSYTTSSDETMQGSGDTPQGIDILSVSDIQMCPMAASYAPDETSELVDQIPSAVRQDISTPSTHGMETRTLSCTRVATETNDINRVTNDDDIIMSDIETAVSESDRLIDQASTPTMTQQYVHHPSGEAVTSHSPIDQVASTITQNIDDLTTVNRGPSLISFQLNTAGTNCDTSDIVPSSASQTVSDLTVGDTERGNILLSSSVQGVIGFQPSSTLSSKLSYSIEDNKSAHNYTLLDNSNETNLADGNQSNFKDIEQQTISIQPSASQCIDERVQSPVVVQVPHLASSISIESESHHAGTSGIQNTNEISISIDLSDVLSNSTLQVPIAVVSSERSSEFNRNSHLVIEPPTNIPSYSTELQRFSTESSYADANLNTTEHCGSISSLTNLTGFQVDLTTPTAGQFHTLIAPTDVHPTLSSNLLTNDTDLCVPVLSEEVQNLLNEDTVAANNFEQNDSILRARCSTSTTAYSPSPPVAVSVQNFTDLENVNEIAENNNNANIERELQDELGNVLAAAIADRSPNPNDEADDNNVMNENRANFDIT